jgi:voltage-gated potassium channel Kch
MIKKQMFSQAFLAPISGLRSHDVSLSVLLVAQAVVIFIVNPLVAPWPTGPLLMDIALLVVAALSALAFANHLSALLILCGSLLVILLGPPVLSYLVIYNAVSVSTFHASVSLVAFSLNFLITGLVIRQTFGAGLVTRHRILGGVLIYLNVGILFSVIFDLLDTFLVGAIQATAGGFLATAPGLRRAELIYFSLTTITTCGYGDLIPLHPLARSLANLEAVFGQLFPATFVARLVALYMIKNETKSNSESR